MTPLEEAKLHKQWADTVCLCNEYKVKPYLKQFGQLTKLVIWDESEFQDYEFPVGIVEDKLVFDNDVLYDRFTGKKYLAKNINISGEVNSWTWKPPTVKEKQMIDTSKPENYRTRDGKVVVAFYTNYQDGDTRILVVCKSGHNEHTSYFVDKMGLYYEGKLESLQCRFDIVEYNVWNDFNEHDPVMVSNNNRFWRRAHFTYTVAGKAYVWRNGTKWSGYGEVDCYDYCRKPTEEERQ